MQYEKSSVFCRKKFCHLGRTARQKFGRTVRPNRTFVLSLLSRHFWDPNQSCVSAGFFYFYRPHISRSCYIILIFKFIMHVFHFKIYQFRLPNLLPASSRKLATVSVVQFIFQLVKNFHSSFMVVCAIHILEWPALWRITMNSLHNEGIYTNE